MMKDCTIQIQMPSGKVWQYNLTTEQAFKLSSYMQKMTSKNYQQEERGSLVGMFED